MAGKYRLSTLGCKVNQYESQLIRQALESRGYQAAGPADDADLAVVNTCAVTEAAMNENGRAIRRAARGGTPVVVVGCGATANAGQMGRIPGVAAVFGHGADLKLELCKFIETIGPEPVNRNTSTTNRTPTGVQPGDALDASSVSDAGGPFSDAPASPAHLPSGPIIPPAGPSVKAGGPMLDRIDGFAGHQRAFLKVQDGCDAFCTYCIIPQLRPVPRSKPIPPAVAEAVELVRAGHKEIILTGIFLGAYGRSTAIRKRFEPGGSPLAELVDAVSRVEGLERLRLSSLEPGDVDDRLLEVLATRPACVPHLHLPLQSGSQDVLRRMNRQYTRDAFLTMTRRVRTALARPALTTDILVGFPGESDREFEQSVEMARHAGFLKIHAFPFSPREGTAAARWAKDFVPTPVVRERMRRLADVEMETSLAFRTELLGTHERIIVENVQPLAGAGASLVSGRADRYFEIHVAAEAKAGDCLRVRVARITPTRTHAVCEGAEERRPLLRPLTVLQPASGF